MKCPNCQARLSNSKAKFCNFCGSPITVEAPVKQEVRLCAACHKQIDPSAKFCHHCGSPQTDRHDQGVAVHHHYVTWHILPGQLALKIDEVTMAEYRSIRDILLPFVMNDWFRELDNNPRYAALCGKIRAL